LAEESGVPRRTIYAMLRGTHWPRVEALGQLATVLSSPLWPDPARYRELLVEFASELMFEGQLGIAPSGQTYDVVVGDVAFEIKSRAGERGVRLIERAASPGSSPVEQAWLVTLDALDPSRPSHVSMSRADTDSPDVSTR